MSFNTPPPTPFNWAQPYNPGASLGFDPGGMGGAIAPLMTQYLMQFAGPTNFLPHQNPAQAITDQLTMRQYFNNTQSNVYGLGRMGTGRVAAGIAGMMSMGTNAPLTDLNRQQAQTMAGLANNPTLKTIIGQMVGPENLEAIMFGSRGDPAALGAAVNRIGLYRPDPATGATHMSAESLEDFSRGVYASLHEPTRDLDEIVERARTGKKGAKGAIAQLKKAANATHQTVVADDDLTTRIADMGVAAVDKIYDKYQPGGKAATVEEKARELIKFDRAVQETGVLAGNETHIDALRKRAERVAVAGAHGFMAGQTGQVMEHLFQRGMLPQSIGALSAADRVKVLSEQKLDTVTQERLAREFGHRDLLENDTEYAAAVRSGNKAKQEEILNEDTVADYSQRIGDSLDKIKKRQAEKGKGPVSADEAEELLAMDGMDSVASNIDASRASSVVKKHTEALAAIRQIFGDNGNPNAPVPALLAALDHLSQGAASRMTNSSKVASTLREMRGMAKEMGMGFDQMANMAAAVGAYGDQIGLAGETKVSAQANAMAMINRMRKDGAFANQGFGALSETEAAQRATAIAARSEGSVVAKGAAAIKRAYAENKDKFEGTELGTIAKKMEEDPNWDGAYEWKGEKKNFYAEAGEKGMQELSRISNESGMTPTQMQTLMRDFMTQEYQQDGAGIKAAKADMLRLVSNRTTAGTISAGISSDKNSRLNANTRQAAGARTAVAQRMTEMIVDSSNMTGADQLKHLEKTMEDEFTKTLVAQGYDEPTAREEAARVIASSFGATPEDRRARLQQTVSSTNVELSELTQGEFRSARQLRQFLNSSGSVGEERRTQKRAADQAERAGLFYQGTPMMRGSDYIAEIGTSGEAFNFDKFLEATFGIAPNSELRDQMAPELAGAFASAQRQISDSTVTDKYLHELAAGKAVDFEGNKITGERAKTELRNLATRGMDAKELDEFNKKFQTEVSDKDVAAKRDAKLDALSDDKVAEIYKQTAGESGGAAKSRTEQLAAIRQHIADGNAVEGFGDAEVLDKGEYTREQLKLEARLRSGGLARDEGFLEEHETRRKRGRARFTGLFGRTEGEVRTGLRTALYDDAKESGYAIDDTTMNKFMELGLYKDGDEKGRAGFEKAVSDSGLTKEQQKQVLKTFKDFRTARDEKIGDKVAPEVSGDPGVPVADTPTAAGKKSAGSKKKKRATPDDEPTTADPAEDTPTETGSAASAPEPKPQQSAASSAARAWGGGTGPEPTQTAAASKPGATATQAGGGQSGDQRMTVTGTLNLLGLQAVVMAARGSPVFTPTGGGPSIVDAQPVSPYASSANVG